MIETAAGVSRPQATINDIARLANVSKRTVSRVLNQSPRLKSETRARVLSIIEEVGYVPDPQARGLAFRQSYLVGFVYDNPNGQYVADMMQGILNVLRGAGFELIVHPYHRRSPGFLSGVRSLVQRQKLFGVVLPPPTSEDEELVAMLNEIRCPYSRIAAVALDLPTRMVVTHDRLGAAEAARHLAELGHRHIAHISGPSKARSTCERRSGFAEGLAERGLVMDERYMLEGTYDFESGIVGTQRLLALKPRPTAIFAANDETAAGVYLAAHEAGLEIPQDLSVVGFDDSPIVSKLWPPLTSVRLPIREMGAIAAKKLLAQSPENGDRELVDLLVTPTLITRRSSSVPKR
ncbi:MAG: LacI family transcriptional regulator [Gammaproteobacteria bacterium]|nr:LacI family transcriptional regulator [Gammaproteobacteria bacterium]